MRIIRLLNLMILFVMVMCSTCFAWTYYASFEGLDADASATGVNGFNECGTRTYVEDTVVKDGTRACRFEYLSGDDNFAECHGLWDVNGGQSIAAGNIHYYHIDLSLSGNYSYNNNGSSNKTKMMRIQHLDSGDSSLGFNSVIINGSDDDANGNAIFNTETGGTEDYFNETTFSDLNFGEWNTIDVKLTLQPDATGIVDMTVNGENKITSSTQTMGAGSVKIGVIYTATDVNGGSPQNQIMIVDNVYYSSEKDYATYIGGEPPEDPTPPSSGNSKLRISGSLKWQG